jgi:zinc protease
LAGGVVALAVALAAAAPVVAQQRAAGVRQRTASGQPGAAPARLDADLAAALPIDASIRTRVLPNGFTYFIRANGRPAKRASMRLAVQAGSIDESNTQRGYAHFLEHMGFNGGAHFKPGELVKYLESIGSSFGADLNAYTSYDETVYMLEIPTDRAGLLDRGLEAMWDFAAGMTLSQVEVERERGVVIEEWRQRRGVGTRVRKQQTPVIYGTSKYALRDPIGTTASLQAASAASIRAFYEKWYRADRMALVVVGDVDVAALEKQIVSVFGKLTKPATPPPARVYPVPPHARPRYSIVADAEAPQSTITIFEKGPQERQDRVGDYRRSLVENLTFQMLNARLAEIARKPDAPFLGANAGKSRLGRGTLASVLTATARDGALPRALTSVTEEAARASRFGFGEAELERARKGVLASYERMFNERNTTESGGLAAELVRHFLEGESVPGIERETEMARRFVPGITAEETAAVARKLLSGANRVVLAVTPQKAGLAVPAQADLAKAIAEADTRELSPWTDAGEGRELMAVKPAPGRVTASRTIPELGVTVLTLSNGAQVWLKPTDFKADQIVFSSYAKGGLSLATPAEFRSTDLATNLVDVSGVNGFNPVELEKLLAGKTAGVSAYISPNTHGVTGAAAPKDLKTAFQLLHLQFTAPGFTSEGFDLLKTRLQAALANRAQNPGAAFGEKLQEVNTLGHYSARPLTTEDLPSLDAGVMRRFYTARFANAADFTFLFGGAFTVEAITPLVERYIASLPSTGTSSGVINDIGLRFPAEIRREVVRKGKEPKAQTVVSFFADTGLDEMEMHRLRAGASVLEMRLLDILREQMGGTYGVNVGYSDNQPVKGYGMVQVVFGSAPDRVDQLVAAVHAEVARLKKEGPSADDVQKVKEIEKRSLETAVKTNAYWVNSLQTVLTLGWDPTSVARRAARTESLSVANVGAALAKYLPENRYTVVTLLPAP